MSISSTAAAHRLFAARPGSQSLLDVAVAAATLAGSLALLAKGGTTHSHPVWGKLDLISVVLAEAVYRILQEALTNATRHGAGSARIKLVFGDEVIELTVANQLRADGAPRSGGGHGLIGMRERAGEVATLGAGGERNNWRPLIRFRLLWTHQRGG